MQSSVLQSTERVHSLISRHLEGEEVDAEMWYSIQEQRRLIDDYFKGRSYGHQFVEKLSTVNKTKPEKKIMWYAVTVNPDTSKVSLEKFIQKCQNLDTLKWVDGDYVYTIEQRGETVEHMGEGYHAHMLLPSLKCMSDVVCNLKKRFPDSAVYVPPPMADVSMYHKYHDYIKGNKEPHKMAKVALDGPWREANRIPVKWEFSALTCVENPTDEVVD